MRRLNRTGSHEFRLPSSNFERQRVAPGCPGLIWIKGVGSNLGRFSLGESLARGAARCVILFAPARCARFHHPLVLRSCARGRRGCCAARERRRARATPGTGPGSTLPSPIVRGTAATTGAAMIRTGWATSPAAAVARLRLGADEPHRDGEANRERQNALPTLPTRPASPSTASCRPRTDAGNSAKSGPPPRSTTISCSPASGRPSSFAAPAAKCARAGSPTPRSTPPGA